MSGGILLITFDKFTGYDSMSETPRRKGSETLMAFEGYSKITVYSYIVRNTVQDRGPYKGIIEV